MSCCMRIGLRDHMSPDAVGSGCRSHNLRQKIIIVDKHLIENIYKLVKVQLNFSSFNYYKIHYLIYSARLHWPTSYEDD